jgi:hypothetical protein
MHIDDLHLKQRLSHWMKEHARFNELLASELYRCQRYGIPVTLALGRIHEPDFETKFKEHGRPTDFIIPLASNHFVLIYENTKIGEAIKALENLRLFFKYGNDVDSKANRIALLLLKPEESISDIIHKATTLFVVALQSKNWIVDDALLER